VTLDPREKNKSRKKQIVRVNPQGLSHLKGYRQDERETVNMYRKRDDPIKANCLLLDPIDITLEKKSAQDSPLYYFYFIENEIKITEQNN
jgi:hypothetical protein